jgi:hypothetical protein
MALVSATLVIFLKIDAGIGLGANATLLTNIPMLPFLFALFGYNTLLWKKQIPRESAQLPLIIVQFFEFQQPTSSPQLTYHWTNCMLFG